MINNLLCYLHVNIHSIVRVHVRVRACARELECARVHVCVRACARELECARVHVCVCACARV